MLTQYAHNHLEIHCIGHFVAEIANSLFVRLHAPEKDLIHKLLKAIAEGIQPYSQNQYDHADE